MDGRAGAGFSGTGQSQVRPGAAPGKWLSAGRCGTLVRLGPGRQQLGAVVRRFLRPGFDSRPDAVGFAGGQNVRRLPEFSQKLAGQLHFLLLLGMGGHPLHPEQAVVFVWCQDPFPEITIREKIGRGKIFIIHALT